MSLVIRSYIKAKHNVLCIGNCATSMYCVSKYIKRSFNDDKSVNSQELINSTIFIENGFQVQELPVVVRKLKNICDIDDKPTIETSKNATGETLKYHLIQSEFRQCTDLRDVFSLLSKCNKITPNIALAAMERIYELENNQNPTIADSRSMHINLAKGAILEKLSKVVMKTEDTQTILNILKTESTLMEPYKHRFSDELLVRVIDNRLSVEELCEFTMFLISNKSDPRYFNTIDKLWVGFMDKEDDINEENIVQIFNILPGLKVSKKIVFALLEQKLSNIWYKMKVPVMQDILSIFIQENYMSPDSFVVVGRWLNTNIHAIDDDTLLDIITKLTRLKYSDNQVEKAVEKYMKLKGSKINTYIIIIGILHYCLEFKIRNEHILNSCSEYFVGHHKNIPFSFLKSFIYPFGFLYFNPINSTKFWGMTEQVLTENFAKFSVDDLCSIVLSFIYNDKYPLELVNKIFSPEYLSKGNNSEAMKQLHLIDTALSLQCKEYAGPLLPKDQWSKPITQDIRVKNIVEKLKESFIAVAGGVQKLSTSVLIPNICSDETYLIDVMLHPAGLGNHIFNWKLMAVKNEIIAVLIHLPDHYCYDNQLIGPQVMRKKHLRILGMKVVSLEYMMLSRFYTTHDMDSFKKYLINCIENAEPCL